MARIASSLIVVCLALSWYAQGTLQLRRGMVITRSVTAARQTYRFAAPVSLDSAVITIRGDDITLDLNGATIVGAEHGTEPDLFAGIAIRVEGGSHVTIKNGTIHGFRFGILAREARELTLRDLELSHSWKPRLYSQVEHESIVDWLSYHHNESREWMRYGAAMYLDGVNVGEIVGITAEQGMNALLCVRCTGIVIHDNTFRFNSGLGVGFYRSSGNQIRRNRLDFNVRGYSHGFYSRGQDSADLLFFEQSSDNHVEFNSATHGGDGFFLWAGQHTMDTGEGGANGNVVSSNDFSFAPANAIEATFSSNWFSANRASGSDYGVWGGYSYGTDILDNCLMDDRIGIAIEHGQYNAIRSNRIDQATVAIRLWADSIVPSDWGYPKHHATGSDNIDIKDNVLSRARVGLQVSQTRKVSIAGTRFTDVDTLMQFRDTANIVLAAAAANRTASEDACGGLPALRDVALQSSKGFTPQDEIPSSALARRDRSAIIVDEWGPYDWRSPKLWPVDSTRTAPLRLAVLGPLGKWRVRSSTGVDTISRRSGSMGDTIAVTPSRNGIRDWRLTLEYVGGLVVTAEGDSVPAGRPVEFSYAAFEPAQRWDVIIRSRTDSAVLDTLHLPRLDFVWSRPTLAKIPVTNWTLDASTRLVLGDGEYTLRTISDDGVRVWVDGKLLIDDWTPHESKVDVATLSGGKHEVRVQYQQVDGWTELQLDVLRGRVRPGGSPGPH